MNVLRKTEIDIRRKVRKRRREEKSLSSTSAAAQREASTPHTRQTHQRMLPSRLERWLGGCSKKRKKDFPHCAERDESELYSVREFSRFLWAFLNPPPTHQTLILRSDAACLEMFVLPATAAVVRHSFTPRHISDSFLTVFYELSCALNCKIKSHRLLDNLNLCFMRLVRNKSSCRIVHAKIETTNRATSRGDCWKAHVGATLVSSGGGREQE